MSRADPTLRVRVPTEVRDWLKVEAARNYRSMNAELVVTLRERMKATGVQFGDPSPAADHDTAHQGGTITHGQ